MILSSPALPSSKKAPVAQGAIAGNGIPASRSHLVVTERALRPNPFAQRSISGAPIGIPQDLLRIYPDLLKAEQHDQRGKTRMRY
jgi:hypothetical protein